MCISTFCFNSAGSESAVYTVKMCLLNTAAFGNALFFRFNKLSRFTRQPWCSFQSLHCKYHELRVKENPLNVQLKNMWTMKVQPYKDLKNHLPYLTEPERIIIFCFCNMNIVVRDWEKVQRSVWFREWPFDIYGGRGQKNWQKKSLL